MFGRRTFKVSSFRLSFSFGTLADCEYPLVWCLTCNSKSNYLDIMLTEHEKRKPVAESTCSSSSSLF